LEGKKKWAGLARAKALDAMAKADSEGAMKFPIEIYSLAWEILEDGNESLLAGDYDTSLKHYRECENLFLQSAKDAREGSFLPQGLEMLAGTIVSMKDGGEMVLIQAGSYVAGSAPGEGSSNEHPRHRVHLKAFYMDRYEVTIGQFKRFAEATGRSLPSGKMMGNSADRNHPITGVSRNDAAAYAQWVGKRLPTEAEWEYACRAGTATRYGTGDSIDHNRANYSGTEGRDRWERTASVGSFAPNAWGLHDMHGNVWEWCQDWYLGNYYMNCPSICPEGPSEGTKAVIRGGSWKDSAHSLRSAKRGYHPPSECRDDTGFRCVK
jgi:formylglycine-generating enzyme required for sulfatase activity